VVNICKIEQPKHFKEVGVRSVAIAILFLLAVAVGSSAFSETGWLKIEKKNTVYYRPFVDVRNPKNKLVIFVTENGKIYKGRCRRKNVISICRITPSKRFPDKFTEMRYIVLELIPDFPPKFLKTGVIKRLNVVNLP
jgi:hypothetical protein